MCQTTLFLRKLNGLRHLVTIRLTRTAHRLMRFLCTILSGSSFMNCKSFTVFWLLVSSNPSSCTRSRTANWWVQLIDWFVCAFVCTRTRISWLMLSPTNLSQKEKFTIMRQGQVKTLKGICFVMLLFIIFIYFSSLTCKVVDDCWQDLFPHQTIFHQCRWTLPFFVWLLRFLSEGICVLAV